MWPANKLSGLESFYCSSFVAGFKAFFISHVGGLKPLKVFQGLHTGFQGFHTFCCRFFKVSTLFVHGFETFGLVYSLSLGGFETTV